MYYALFAAGAAGILGGYRFRAFALIAFSVLILWTMIAASLILQWPVGRAVLATVLVLTVFQAGYLCGLFWRFALPKAAVAFREIRETKDQISLRDVVQVFAGLVYGHQHRAKLAGMGGPIKSGDSDSPH